jgi:hypothetical protein
MGVRGPGRHARAGGQHELGPTAGPPVRPRRFPNTCWECARWSPGYPTWLVEPQSANLGWAAGTVPTPYGPIAVSWWQTMSRGLRLELWVPAGTRGNVGLLLSGANASLSDNGRSVTGVDAAQAAEWSARLPLPAELGARRAPPPVHGQ